MPSTIIEKEATPVSVIHDQMNPLTPYVILDVNGTMRAQFVKQEEADAFAASVNDPQEAEPEETKAEPDDKEVERDQEDHEQQKEDDMPRGIPNKKAAVKKRAASAKKTVKKRAATAVKKAAKKFSNKVKKKVGAKRRTWRE